MILLDNREVKKDWEGLKAQVDGILSKHGAEIVVAKRWDERKLAYEIKKQKRATYYLNYFKADPQKVVDINFDFKLAQPVLRHLILRVESIPEEAYAPEREFDLESLDRGSENKETPAAKPEKSDEDATEAGGEEEAAEAAAPVEGESGAPAGEPSAEAGGEDPAVEGKEENEERPEA